MLGVRRHFLTKSQGYSTTFRAICAERRDWRLREELDQLDRDTASPQSDPGRAGDRMSSVRVVPKTVRLCWWTRADLFG